jgi:hypothetical protein
MPGHATLFAAFFVGCVLFVLAWAIVYVALSVVCEWWSREKGRER